MTTAGVWLRVGATTALAGASVVGLSPPHPELRTAPVAAAMGGAIVGLVLFTAVARRRPQVPPATLPFSLLVARWALLGLLAANEELIWRRVLLGECLRVGVVAALAGSTFVFAVAHRARPGLHLCTGAIFGGLYVATGVLAASIAAHWTYNLLLSTVAEPGHAAEATGS
jgi:membrane protease YdiL (CAAX protease family)